MSFIHNTLNTIALAVNYIFGVKRDLTLEMMSNERESARIDGSYISDLAFASPIVDDALCAPETVENEPTAIDAIGEPAFSAPEQPDAWLQCHGSSLETFGLHVGFEIGNAMLDVALAIQDAVPYGGRGFVDWRMRPVNLRELKLDIRKFQWAPVFNKDLAIRFLTEIVNNPVNSSAFVNAVNAMMEELNVGASFRRVYYMRSSVQTDETMAAAIASARNALAYIQGFNIDLRMSTRVYAVERTDSKCVSALITPNHCVRVSYPDGVEFVVDGSALMTIEAGLGRGVGQHVERFLLDLNEIGADGSCERVFTILDEPCGLSDATPDYIYFESSGKLHCGYVAEALTALMELSASSDEFKEHVERLLCHFRMYLPRFAYAPGCEAAVSQVLESSGREALRAAEAAIASLAEITIDEAYKIVVLAGDECRLVEDASIALV